MGEAAGAVVDERLDVPLEAQDSVRSRARICLQFDEIKRSIAVDVDELPSRLVRVQGLREGAVAVILGNERRPCLPSKATGKVSVLRLPGPHRPRRSIERRERENVYIAITIYIANDDLGADRDGARPRKGTSLRCIGRNILAAERVLEPDSDRRVHGHLIARPA